MKKYLYLSPLGFFISICLNIIRVFKKPIMVYGYFDLHKIKYYKHIRISSSTVINSPQNLEILDYNWIWHFSILDASNGISIGEGCQIGAYVGIFSHSSHMAIRLMGKHYINSKIEDRVGYINGKVEIGEFVFIGTASIIYPGAKIGKGCIVLSGSHVKGEIPDYSIVSGNPAKVVTTIDNLDRMYLKNRVVQKNYFDKQLLDNLLTKYKIHKYD